MDRGVGGTITPAAPQVVAQQGSTFNISGGSVQYQGGYVSQTYLLGSDGRIYNVNNAPTNLTYLAVANGFVVTHSQGGKVNPKLTQVYLSPFGHQSVQWQGRLHRRPRCGQPDPVHADGDLRRQHSSRPSSTASVRSMRVPQA